VLILASLTAPGPYPLTASGPGTASPHGPTPCTTYRHSTTNPATAGQKASADHERNDPRAAGHHRRLQRGRVKMNFDTDEEYREEVIRSAKEIVMDLDENLDLYASSTC
jgi:hypothetical protein